MDNCFCHGLTGSQTELTDCEIDQTVQTFYIFIYSLKITNALQVRFVIGD